MDLQNFKKQVEEAQFPKDTQDAILNIIGMAMTRGGELTQEENKEILNLIDDAIVKNVQENKKALDVLESIQDFQDEFVAAVDEEYKQQQIDESKNQSATPAAPVDPAAPTTQTP